MTPKQGLDLDRVVLLGRTFEEYSRYFGLALDQLRNKAILDVAAGVSSFRAEASEPGLDVTAFDVIYNLPTTEIQHRCERDLDHIVSSIADLKVYRWEFYKSPERLRTYRERAYKTFLSDYSSSNRERYVFGELPITPFRDRQFDLTLVSYFLFVYEDQLSYEFHCDSIRELMRITSGEIRIYPIVTFEAARSVYLDRLQHEPDFQVWSFDVVRTDFEFLRNSNFYLSIRRKV